MSNVIQQIVNGHQLAANKLPGPTWHFQNGHPTILMNGIFMPHWPPCLGDSKAAIETKIKEIAEKPTNGVFMINNCSSLIRLSSPQTIQGIKTGIIEMKTFNTTPLQIGKEIYCNFIFDSSGNYTGYKLVDGLYQGENYSFFPLETKADNWTKYKIGVSVSNQDISGMITLSVSL